MVKSISANEASRNFGNVIDGALRGEDYVITRYGKPKVVVVDFVRYKELEEAAERALLESADRDPETRAAIERGLRDMEEGRFFS